MATNKKDYEETPETGANIASHGLSNWGMRVTKDPLGVVTDFFVLLNELQTALVSNAAVIGKVLTGYVSGAGTVAATDTILQAIQKLNGNIAAMPKPFVPMATWDASSGTFPSGDLKGYTHKVTVGGTVDGVVFTVNDMLVAEIDAPSTTVFTGNWQKWDVQDQVISVNGVTGVVSGLEATANKDATGGYAGLTLFKINFKNAANTFTSFLTNVNTAARTYTFPDKDGTVAMTSDVALTNFTESNYTYSGTTGVKLLATNAATNVDFVAQAKGTGANLAQQPDGTTTGGNNRGANAVDWQTVRTAATQVASGLNSVISGGRYNTSSGLLSAIPGGNNNTASGITAIVLAGGTNTASGTAAIAGGQQTNAYLYCTFTHSSGFFAAIGDCQTQKIVLRGATTDATPKVLTADAAAAGTLNQLILENNQGCTFTGKIIAFQKRSNSTPSIASWTIEGSLQRVANAAATTLNSAVITEIHNPSAWTIALTADTTNGGLAVTFTGQASKDIRIGANIEFIQVTYA